MKNDMADLIELSKYRGYLHFLARTHLPARYAGKLDASDIVQQTLLQAHANQGQFQGHTEAELRAWLRKILVRQLSHATRELHAGKRDIKREQSIEAALDASSMRLENFLAAKQSSPSHQVMRQENVHIIADAIEKLSALHRQVVILRYWEGKSLRELSESLGKSTAAVVGLLNRARTNLRRILQDRSSL